MVAGWETGKRTCCKSKRSQIPPLHSTGALLSIYFSLLSAEPAFTLHLRWGQRSQTDEEIEQLLYQKQLIGITCHSGNDSRWLASKAWPSGAIWDSAFCTKTLWQEELRLELPTLSLPALPPQEERTETDWRNIWLMQLSSLLNKIKNKIMFHKTLMKIRAPRTLSMSTKLWKHTQNPSPLVWSSGVSFIKHCIWSILC